MEMTTHSVSAQEARVTHQQLVEQLKTKGTDLEQLQR